MGRYVLLIVIFVSCAGLSACAGPLNEQQQKDQLYDQFKTAVATASQDGYTPYWLGTSFKAGGLEFQGPFTAVIAHEVSGGGVSTDYDADAPGGGIASVNITSYSPGAWSRVSAAFKTEPASAVRVAGHDARYSTSSIPSRPVLEVSVTIQFGATTVVAYVNSLGSAHAPTPGPDLNPLIDEQTLLSVLQHLRPYPQ
jgi:hypothetical protein